MFIIRIPCDKEILTAEDGRSNKENKNEDKFTKPKRAETLNQKKSLPGYRQI